MMEYLDVDYLKSLDDKVANAICSLANIVYHERRVTKLTMAYLSRCISELYKSPELAPTLDSFTKEFKEDLDYIQKGFGELKLRRKNWEKEEEKEKS